MMFGWTTARAIDPLEMATARMARPIRAKVLNFIMVVWVVSVVWIYRFLRGMILFK